MISKEEYLEALVLIDQYHRQKDRILLEKNIKFLQKNDSGIKTPRAPRNKKKTLISNWKYINICSARLRNILQSKPIQIRNFHTNEKKELLVNGWKYIEDIKRHDFLHIRNAGVNTWNEFVRFKCDDEIKVAEYLNSLSKK